MAKTSKITSLLFFTAMQNHPHCVNELLINGADFTKTDFNGDNALSLAMQNESKQAQRVLENHILAMLKGLVTGKEAVDWKKIMNYEKKILISILSCQIYMKFILSNLLLFLHHF